MKKFFISLALAIATVSVSAQTVSISTYNGTDMTQYAGQVKDVRTYRQMFNGWNTVSLPFSMTEEQVNETFGADCRLEKLSGASQNGSTIYLNFKDVKSQGIQANTPYLLYYTREDGAVNINLKSVRLEDTPSQIFFTTNQGATVSMNGVQTAKDGAGLYGIRVVDNKEAHFVDVTEIKSKFYATRCFLEVSGVNNPEIIALHNAETTGINSVSAANAENSDIAYDLSGRRVSKTAKGIKIINGKKQF